MTNDEHIPRAMRVVPCIGQNPSGSWIGTGLARALLVERLGITADYACAALGEHLGTTIPFMFAEWFLSVSYPQEGSNAETCGNFSYRHSAPDISPDKFRDLFFWGDEINHDQWSVGIFGGSTRGKWRWFDTVQGAMTVHDFTVKGTVLDKLALHRAFGIPYDADLVTARNHARMDNQYPVLRQSGRPKGTAFSDNLWVDKILELHSTDAAKSIAEATRMVVNDNAEIRGASLDAKIKRLSAKAAQARASRLSAD